MTGQSRTQKTRARRFERLRHVLWASVITLVLAVLTVLDPLDQVLWVAQSQAVKKEASGEIVFVESRTDLADPNRPERRIELAQAIRRLSEAGAAAVYVDVDFELPSTAKADRALNASLQEFSGESYLVRSLEQVPGDDLPLMDSTPAVGSGVESVGADVFKNYLGYVWEDRFAIRDGNVTLPTFAATAAARKGEGGEIFPIDYSISAATIPTLQLHNVVSEATEPRSVRNRIVVIGPSSGASRGTVNVPGAMDVSPTIPKIIAAETLLAGGGTFLSKFWLLGATFAALLAVCGLIGRARRQIAYAAVVVVLLTAIGIGALTAIRTGYADAVALILIYGLFRLRARWKDSFALVDPETDLPAFAALEADKSIAESVPAIIVARIHKFEQVRRSLPKELHGEYVLRIIARLKAATQDAKIYRGDGHLIAWTMDEKDPALLQEHLEGLRALFSAPLIVGDRQVDVGITFGVDITPSPDVVRRLASAVAAAEQTNETFDPIAVADSTSEEDLIWNVSLQARIDAALSNGEIYLVYQPKVMVQTGEIVGVEALVRWKDPVKGHIPPDNFIRQCETAGRMAHLTRFVLENACRAGNAFAERGINLPIAVNISATLVHERAIVELVSNVLASTGFEPRRLTLEITETYRISNIDTAAEILGELHALGPKISMDDFGVGAASLEALLRLPFGELKIDRLFTSRITSDRKAAGIVENILRLGKDLRIIVVAEGVEDAGTLTKLRDSGCLVAQGFGISRPVEFEKIVSYHDDREKRLMQNMV